MVHSLIHSQCPLQQLFNYLLPLIRGYVPYESVSIIYQTLSAGSLLVQSLTIESIARPCYYGEWQLDHYIIVCVYVCIQTYKQTKPTQINESGSTVFFYYIFVGQLTIEFGSMAIGNVHLNGILCYIRNVYLYINIPISTATTETIVIISFVPFYIPHFSISICVCFADIIQSYSKVVPDSFHKCECIAIVSVAN